MKPLGTLTVICGSMYAGKSEELIRLVRRALYAKKKVQVFKPAVENRYSESMIVTHMGVQHDAIPIKDVNHLDSLIEYDTEVVAIEEAQFLDHSLTELCVDLADAGKHVIVAGLDQDFRRQPFGPMPYLLCAADEVIKLRAICMKSGQPASHTYRTIDGKPAHKDDPIVLIGATEAYEARSRNCYSLKGVRKRTRHWMKKPKGTQSSEG